MKNGLGVPTPHKLKSVQAWNLRTGVESLGVQWEEVTDGLSSGICIIGGKKVLVN